MSSIQLLSNTFALTNKTEPRQERHLMGQRDSGYLCCITHHTTSTSSMLMLHRPRPINTNFEFVFRTGPVQPRSPIPQQSMVDKQHRSTPTLAHSEPAIRSMGKGLPSPDQPGLATNETDEGLDGIIGHGEDLAGFGGDITCQRDTLPSGHIVGVADPNDDFDGQQCDDYTNDSHRDATECRDVVQRSPKRKRAESRERRINQVRTGTSANTN